MPLSTEERNLMRHALGLNQSPKAYRNRYFAEPESRIGRIWCRLVSMRLAKVVEQAEGQRFACYAVTDLGISQLGKGISVAGLEPNERYP